MANEIIRYAAGVRAHPPALQVRPALPPSASDLDPRAIVRALWRRKLLMGGIVAGVAILTVAVLQSLTPVYRAETLLRIESTQPTVVDLGGLAGEVELDDPTIESEIEYLNSRAFLALVVDQLNLVTDSEFNTVLQPQDGPLAVGRERIEAALRDVAARVGVALPLPDAGASDGLPETRRERVIQALDKALVIDQVPRSHVISVRVLSEDPAKAAHIANAAAQAYLQAQLMEKRARFDRASLWLRQRVTELRARMLDSEHRIIELQGDSGVAGEARVDPIAQQIAQLNIRLAEAQAARAEAEARFRGLSSLASSGSGLRAAGDVVNSPLLAELRAQQSALDQRLGELATIYGQRHPQLINLQGEIASVRSRIRDEVRRIISEQQNEVDVARAREQELARQLGALENQVRGQERSSVELRTYEREAEGAREIYQSFLQRLRQLEEAIELQTPDARIISAAEVPLDPSWPNKKLILVIAVGVAGVVATGIAFLLDRLSVDHGFRSGEEIEAELGLRAFALVPALTGRETRKSPPEDYVLLKPSSAFAEAVQRIRTGLFLSGGTRPCQSVVVTSSVPTEGKSLLAIALAFQSARSGMNVLLLDADFRRPRVHEVLGCPNTIGLAQVLAREASFKDAVHRDSRTRLHVLPAGAMPASPPDLLRLQLPTLLEELDTSYDLIVIDTPPVAAVADATIAAGLADRTVFVVRWATTPRGLVRRCLQQLAEAGVEIAGIAVSRVDMREHARYGYADSGYYGDYDRAYYAN